MEVDELLAEVSALKDARGVGDEAGGTEPRGHDSCEGGSHRQEEEAWTDYTSNTLDQIERELMALKANKRGKGGKGGKGEGFQGNCNYCGKYGHRLNGCWAKDQDMKAKGGSWSNKGGGNGPKGQGSLHNVVSRSTTDVWKGGRSSLRIQGRSLGSCCQRRCFGEEGKGNGTQAKVERIGLMEFPRRVVRSMEEHGKQYL